MAKKANALASVKAALETLMARWVNNAEGLTWHEDAQALSAVYTSAQGHPSLTILRRGQTERAAVHARFHSTAERDRHLERWLVRRVATLRERESVRAQRAEDNKQPHRLEVGSVLYTSWGYEQTNVDFYQVTRLVAPRTVEVRQIGSQEAAGTSSGDMSEYVLPARDAFLAASAFNARVIGSDAIRVDGRYMAKLHDGRPVYRSWYA